LDDLKTNHETEIATLNSKWCDKNNSLQDKIASLEKKLARNAIPFTTPMPPSSSASTETTRLLQMQEKINLLWRKVDDMDQYTKRPNLIIDGIPIRRGETPKQIKKAVLAKIDRLKLPIDDCELDRAHRTSQPYTDPNGIRKQPVIARFVSWGARNTLYQARNASKFKYRADLTHDRLSTLSYARSKIDNDANVAETINYVFADKNCRFQASCSDGGRLLSFSTADEFDHLITYLNDTSANNKAHPQIHNKYDLPDFKADIDEQLNPINDWSFNLPSTPTYANVAGPSSSKD